MYCTISISGQPHGNYELFRKLRNSTEHSKHFHGQRFTLKYNKVSEARKDLKEAFKELKEEEPDYDGIYIYNDVLYYDASKAKLEK